MNVLNSFYKNIITIIKNLKKVKKKWNTNKMQICVSWVVFRAKLFQYVVGEAPRH